MKVVHVVPYKLDPYSGVYTSVVGVASAVAGAGYEVEVWNLSPWPAGTESLVDDLTRAGVTVREIPPSNRSWTITAGAKEMVDALDADILHLHSAFSPQNNLLARRVDRPVVLSPHGVLLAGSLQKSSLRKQIFRRLIELPALRSTAAVCALTDAEAAEVRAFGFDGRIEVIPNGVGAPDPGADRSALRRVLGVSPSARIGLYVGRIQIDHKRLDDAVAAFSAAPDWHLVIIGADYRGDEAVLAELIRHLPGRERIHLAGPKRGEELAEAFAGAYAFVLLSQSEGMSMALLEAFSYGLPAIVSHEVEEAMEVGAAGWATRPSDLSGLLTDLAAAPPSDWDKRREAARAVASGYRWEAIATDYVDLYRSLVR